MNLGCKPNLPLRMPDAYLSNSQHIRLTAHSEGTLKEVDDNTSIGITQPMGCAKVPIRVSGRATNTNLFASCLDSYFSIFRYYLVQRPTINRNARWNIMKQISNKSIWVVDLQNFYSWINLVRGFVWPMAAKTRPCIGLVQTQYYRVKVVSATNLLYDVDESQ